MTGFPPMIMPYSEFLGLQFAHDTDGRTIMVMPDGAHLEGRPGYLHGGALAGLLECAVIEIAMREIERIDGKFARPINLTINFLRGAPSGVVYAGAEIVKEGGRVVAVEARAWQGDRNRPVAIGHVNMMR